VTAGGAVLRTTHVAVAPSEAMSPAITATATLRGALLAHHLRFLRDFLAPGEAAPAELPQAAPGVLAVTVVGAAGDARRGFGEEQVPADWLRAVFLLAGLAQEIEVRGGVGVLRRAVALGAEIAAVVERGDDGRTTTFLDPRRADGRCSAVLHEAEASIGRGARPALDPAVDLDAVRRVMAAVKPEMRGAVLTFDEAEVVLAPAQQAATQQAVVRPERGVTLEALNDLVERTRASLGGPVMRNYWKKAREEIVAAYPALDAYRVSLDGRISAGGGGEGTPEALLAWARAFLARACAIAPSLAPVRQDFEEGDRDG
jgi:hypothetical protein